MTQTIAITKAEAQEVLSLYRGKTVARAWRGHGSAIFLDLPDLSITIEWSWRLESETSTVAGSWSDDEVIDRVPDMLTGLTIKAISFFGRLPEISIEFSDGYWLSSFATAEGDPEWTVRYDESRYIYFENGQFVREV